MGYALLFDCDGVLAETERFGHLVAFNQMFAEFGLPVRWSDQEYAERLKVGGGKERLATLLTEDFVQKACLPTGMPDQRQMIADWHKRKTDIYVELVKSGRIPGRPGIARIAGEALAANWQVAICSTSADKAVRAVLDHVVGKEVAARFAVLAGDVVPRKKPAPDVYQLALEYLGVRYEETLAIEDSRQGLLAAVGAGLHCVVTPSTYTQDEDVHEATMVLSDLGDPGRQMRILENRGRARPGAYATLGDLAACLP
jgi:HAD superfamily hydrolase (TIGR01509 family)